MAAPTHNMVLVILGFILLIAGRVLSKSSEPKARMGGRPLMGLAILMMIGGIVSASLVQIGAGEIGIRTLYGKVQKDILNSGLHLVNPLMEVEKTTIRTLNYTMSGVHDEGKKGGDDAIRVLSADGLEVTMDLTVLYRVIPSEAPRLLRETGLDFEDKIVRPIARTKIRDNAVYYDAVALYSTKRDEFQNRLLKSLDEEFRRRGLLLESVLIRNITLPATVRDAIERKIQAEQEAQKMQFVLQKEAQEAERKRVEAQGIADYQRIIAEGLGDKQLQYEQIKAMRELAESPNSKIIFMGKGSAPVILDAK